MIGPAILKGRLIEAFREHLLNFNYYHIINNGDRVVNYEIKKLNVDEADSIVKNFMESNIPIVCLAGSKSTVPFWDYHCAINIDLEKNEAYLDELLIKGSLEKNLACAITMAYYVLCYKTNGIKRLVLPLILTGNDIGEEIKFEVIENKTILYRVDEELINDVL